jgi:hypothetical protein
MKHEGTLYSSQIGWEVQEANARSEEIKSSLLHKMVPATSLIRVWHIVTW